MDRLYTSGPSVIDATTYENITLTVSIISRRAFRIMIQQDCKGKWGRPISILFPAFGTEIGIIVGAFCPETGYFTGFKEK